MLHNIVKVLDAVESFTLKWLISYYVNLTSVIFLRQCLRKFYTLQSNPKVNDFLMSPSLTKMRTHLC